jgi:uncharacterized repeat protein (TIGR03943 family)
MVVAVTSRTQGLVLAFLAAVLIRMSLTGEYLRFVTPWMRWPLLVTGVILLGMAIRPALSWRTSPSDGTPTSAWLLLLPPLVFFAVAPPPLGAFVAERRTADPTSLPEPGVVGLPQSEGPVPITVDEFVWGVSQPDDPMGIRGREVTMTGFVSHDKGGGWYVTMLDIGCCAADAVVSRVRVTGHEAPPRDQWLEVTGTWVEGTGAGAGAPATLDADQVVETNPPREVYG